MIPDQRACELCTTMYTPPLNRPEWPRCIACTLTPVHARRARRGAAPAYPLPRASADSFTFLVPGPPIGKNRTYRAAYAKAGQFRGAVYKTDEARKFQANVAIHAKVARPTGWRQDRRYALALLVYFDNERADVDGPLSLVQDALQGIVYVNDRQVVQTSAERAFDKTAPRIVVTVSQMEVTNGV